MSRPVGFRSYLTIKVDEAAIASVPQLLEFKKAYDRNDFEGLKNAISFLFKDIAGSQFSEFSNFKITSAPSMSFELSLPGSDDRSEERRALERSERILALQFADTTAVDKLREFVRSHVATSSDRASKKIFSVAAAADPVALGTLEASPPRVSHAGAFGTRRRARELIRAGELVSRGLDGSGVNVVIVDRGLNCSALEGLAPGSWGGGLNLGLPGQPTIKAGSAPARSHGMMIARNVLDLAPKAKIYDVPLLPPLIGYASLFASTANAAFHAIAQMIAKLLPAQGDRWVIVNAWAIFDRSTEYPEHDYTRNVHETLQVGGGSPTINIGHPLNHLIGEMVSGKDGLPRVDFVFGAGNCGQFASPHRCGALDRGPGCSIWGANSHPDVYTAAAVTVNGSWLGYSSQGPAAWPTRDTWPDDKWKEELAQKPDFAAPSQFYEDDDKSTLNSGTSAAAAVAAGVIAAIRSEPRWASISPWDLKSAMRRSARGADGWNQRTGCGIIDIPALCRMLDTPS